MMCKYPYIRKPHTTRFETRANIDKRLAATPFGCGQCMPCRINKAREWSHRLMLEQMAHDHSCFITLTYTDDFCPVDLQPKHLTKFFKKLRKKYGEITIRYFAVGEYGSLTWRPHYHIALFGLGLEIADDIESLWGKGFIQIGELNQTTARYIVGYVTKKLTKKGIPKLNGHSPEFQRSSKQRGGMGLASIKKIAENIKNDPNYDGHIIRSLQHGKKTLPLGRYLTHKLATELGISEEQFKAEFFLHQEEIFNQHMRPNEFFYYNVKDEKIHERHVQEKKQKLYNNRKETL